MTAALRMPAIRRYVALYGLTSGLEWVINIALMVLVFEQTGSSAVAALMLLLSNVLPAVGVAAASDVFDRVPARRMLISGLALQGTTIVAIGITAGSAVALLLLAAVVGVAGSVVRASVRGGVAVAAAGNQDFYRASTALVNLVRSAITFAGPAAAGVSIALVGAPHTLLAAGGAALVAAVILPVTRPDRWLGSEPAHEGEVEEEAVVTEVPNASLLALLLGLGAVVSCAFYMDEPVLLPFSTDDLGAGVAGYAAIFAAWGGGVMLGSALFTRVLDRPMLRVCGIATSCTALAYVALGASPTLPLALAVCVLGGIANGFDWPALAAAVQEAAPRDRQASAAARLESMLNAGPAVGIIVGGVMADAVSNRFAIALAGLVVLVAVALGVAAHRRILGRPQASFSIPRSVIPGGTS